MQPPTTEPASTEAPQADKSVAWALRELRSKQKPGVGVPAYTRWINRPLGRLAAAFFFSAGWSPNMVSALSFALSIGGVAVLVLMPVWVATGVLASILFALGYILDSADGQVARLIGKPSASGEWLDHVVDAYRGPLVHAAVAFALINSRGVPGVAGWAYWLALAFTVLTAGHFMSQILAEQLARRAGENTPATGGSLLSLALLPIDTGAMCWMFIFWGLPRTFLIVYGVFFALNLTYAAVSAARKYRALSQY